MSVRPLVLGLLISMTATGVHAQSSPSPSIERWGNGLGLDPRIHRELQRFSEGTSLTAAQAAAFAQAIRSRVFSAAGGRVSELTQGECNPFIDVSIGDPGLSPAVTPGIETPDDERKVWEKFVDSVVRTEMVACIDTGITDPAAVLETYVSPEFRMAAEGRITDMWEDDEGSCMETKGVLSLVDPTRVCNRIHDFREEGVAAQHSQVVFNQGTEPYEDVYFKESLKTFVTIPGGVALHYINYARAGGLGRLKRWAGPGQIRGSQEGNVEELRKWLSGGSQAPSTTPEPLSSPAAPPR